MKSAQDILGNPNYRAISFGGYRKKSRDFAPSKADLKEDLKILSALGIKILRTYHAQQFPETERLLAAIAELKAEDPAFEMYLMLGAWIECKGAWTDNPRHNLAHEESNKAEIQAAIDFAKQYPDIVKVIAVGNEAMVHWASGYFVHPSIILKEVKYLQQLKQKGDLPKDLWVTSSDNFASWGGGGTEYHIPELVELIKAVDYISLHSYPFHDTHYNPDYWRLDSMPVSIEKEKIVEEAMQRAVEYTQTQFRNTRKYIESLGIQKEIHLGETGWATSSPTLYGDTGSRAADEYKQKIYHDLIRSWTDRDSISCFFFEAFDEPWKDPNDERGSENHFGLIDIQSQAKYLLWEQVDQGLFDGLIRNGKPITKTYEGELDSLLLDLKIPPLKTNK